MAISLDILLFFSTSLFLILNYRHFLILDFLRMKMLEFSIKSNIVICMSNRNTLGKSLFFIDFSMRRRFSLAYH